MVKKFSTRELSDMEITILLDDKNFSSFKPVSCKDCGYKGGFKRRIFQVDGISNAPKKRDDDQNFLRYHMKQKYGFDHVLFRVKGTKQYIETAFCEKCNSNIVIFDIELSDEMTEKISSYLNIPAKTIKSDIDKIISRM